MNEKLLRYLLEQQLLTAEQADELRRAQEETNKSIRELILERAILPEEQVIEALSSLTRTPVVHLYEMTIPMDVRQAVRPDILRTYTMMPFQFDPEDSGTLYVAMNEPMNMKGRDMVAIASKCRIKPFLATTSDILVTIDRCYGRRCRRLPSFTPRPTSGRAPLWKIRSFRRMSTPPPWWCW